VRSALTPLQQRLAEEFFARESRFVLSGGGALAGFLLGHRETHDLDFFAAEPCLDQGEAALGQAAQALGATVERLVSGNDFRRFLVKKADASVVVDLVYDHTPRSDVPPPKFGEIVVAPPQEILANKLCTLLSRSEPRDLVDVFALDRAGYRIEEAVPLAARKDGGFTPAQLSWVLSQVAIGDDADVPGGMKPADLRAFLTELQKRLGQVAWPYEGA
jgi:hypothetical protein